MTKRQDGEWTKRQLEEWNRRAFARERAWRKKAARQQKHRMLTEAVVREALAFWRYMRTPAPKTPVGLKNHTEARNFGRACAALEKFEMNEAKRGRYHELPGAKLYELRPGEKE